MRKTQVRLIASLWMVFSFGSGASAWALTPGSAPAGDELSLLTGLEERAAAAAVRDKPYLYSELLHAWTELAGRQMAAGDDLAVVQALQHADADAAKLHAALAEDSKRLKNAEMQMDRAAHRLSDMLRVASQEQHDSMQTILKHLNTVHDDLLAQLFSH